MWNEHNDDNNGNIKAEKKKKKQKQEVLLEVRVHDPLEAEFWARQAAAQKRLFFGSEAADLDLQYVPHWYKSAVTVSPVLYDSETSDKSAACVVEIPVCKASVSWGDRDWLVGCLFS